MHTDCRISTENTRHEIALTTEQQVPLEQMTQNHQGSHGEAVSTSLDMSTSTKNYCMEDNSVLLTSEELEKWLLSDSHAGIAVAQNVVIEWLTLLFCIWEVPGSNISVETSYPG
jgi:heme-binding NEAT domain protein